jgi:plastocyanin
MRSARIASALALGLLAVFALAACGDDDETSADTAAVTENESQPAGGGYGAGAAQGPEEPSKPGGDAPRAETVEMVDFAFEPSRATIEAGGKVTWKNQGQAPHTATADDDSFDTGTVDAGKLAAETFKEAGRFSYICTIHPDMKGTIEVVE